MQSVITGSIEGVIADMVKPYVAPPTEQVRHYRFQCDIDDGHLTHVVDIAMGLKYTYSETERATSVRFVYATSAGENCHTNHDGDFYARTSITSTGISMNESWPVTKKNEKGQYIHIHTPQIYELSFEHYLNYEDDYDADKTHVIKLILTSVPGQAPAFKLVSCTVRNNDGQTVDYIREYGYKVTFSIREADDPVHTVGAPLLPTH